jgi:hypothetical protein
MSFVGRGAAWRDEGRQRKSIVEDVWFCGAMRHAAGLTGAQICAPRDVIRRHKFR